MQNPDYGNGENTSAIQCFPNSIILSGQHVLGVENYVTIFGIGVQNFPEKAAGIKRCHRDE